MVVVRKEMGTQRVEGGSWEEDEEGSGHVYSGDMHHIGLLRFNRQQVYLHPTSGC